MEVSRRQIIALGGLGAFAALFTPDAVRRSAFATDQLAISGTVGFTWVRDKIEIGQSFEQELRQELTLRGVAKGTTVCLIAREIVHTPYYTLRLAGYPLVIAADTYDCRNGAIDTTNYGVAGSTAAPITLLARHVVGARLAAMGTTGATGAPGEPGEPGMDSESGETPTGKPICFSHGTNGGPGGMGGQGGPGGTGGAIGVGGLFNSLLMDHTEGLLFAWLTAVLFAGNERAQNAGLARA
jgi:hypothetical protein